MSNTWILGIDPGVNGALALVEPVSRTIINIWDTPNYTETLTTGKNRKSIKIDALINIYKVIQQAAAGDDIDIKVQIERVQAYGKQSAPAAFNFGYAAAIPYVMARVFEWPIAYVSSVSWKRQFQLQATNKDAARIFVLKHFPKQSEFFKRKKDIDRADAVLIAFYRGNGKYAT